MTTRAARRGGAVDRGRLRGADGGAARARPRAARAPAAAARRAGARARRARSPATSGAPTRFTGYETEEQQTTVVAVRSSTEPRATATAGRRGSAGALLVKLAESPFYAAGGGQVSDVGTIECEHGDCRARVEDVIRLGEDQALEVVVEQGTLEAGEARARARRPPRAARDRVQPHRHPPAAGGAARAPRQPRAPGRLLRRARQAALRLQPRPGAQRARSSRDVEDRVNEWIARNDPVRAITTTLDEAKRLGAMALFGEKYGEVVRMVEIGDGEYSRELCGGTHVRSTAEIGAVPHPQRDLERGQRAAHRGAHRARGGRAAARARPPARGRSPRSCARAPRTPPRRCAGARAGAQAPREGAEGRRAGDRRAAELDVDALAGAGRGDRRRARARARRVEVADAKALLDVADRLKGRARRRRDPARHGRRRPRAPASRASPPSSSSAA